MWFGTPNGLTALSSGRWRGYTVKDGLPGDDVTSLEQDSQGVIWIGTSQGLAFLSTGEIKAPSRPREALKDQVSGVAEDRAGWLWVFTSKEVLHVERNKLLSGALTDDDVHKYGVEDGLRSVGGIKRQESVVVDPLGRIWSSMERGLSVIDPSQLKDSVPPPIIQIRSITADSSVIDLRSVTKLAAPPRRLTFAYSGLCLRDPDRVRFRYRLDGYDKNWSDSTAAHEATYTKLEPGSYRFRVTACNNSGVWNEADAFLDFSVAPAYYQTIWFRSLCVAAFWALLWGLYQLRLRQVAQQFNMRLEERVSERTRIARDLHDTLLQSFQGVLLRFQAAINLLPPGEAKQRFEGAIDQAAQAITEGRDAVQGLRSSTTVTNDLARAITTFGQELASSETNPIGAEFHVGVEGTPRDLHPILRDEVYRIAGEAVRNAFKHAEAKRIEVEIRYDERQLRLRVRDDGKGIYPKLLNEDRRPGHYGLRGIRERAKLLGGKLTVWSELNSGTEVELRIPASRAYETSPAQRR
jgi:signal transduction histidine kinase